MARQGEGPRQPFSADESLVAPAVVQSTGRDGREFVIVALDEIHVRFQRGIPTEARQYFEIHPGSPHLPVKRPPWANSHGAQVHRSGL